MLDVYAQESSFQSERASVHTHRLGGNEDPTTLYEQGPRTWPSLALRKESDQVLEVPARRSRPSQKPSLLYGMMPADLNFGGKAASISA